MQLKIIEYTGAEHIIKCKSFEFRTNQVSNWIRVKFENGETKDIHQICVIETLD